MSAAHVITVVKGRH